jgi:hypothetical protein
VIDDDQSDSAKLDAALELLVRGGRDVRHAQAMLVPQVWEGARDLDPAVRDFYRYHSCLVEPWDGPAGLIFTDGRRVGATLDRNGLRPLRYHVCEDGTVVASSEVGAVPPRCRPTTPTTSAGAPRAARPGSDAVRRPGRGRAAGGPEIKLRLGAHAPYGDWLEPNLRQVTAGRPSSRPRRPQAAAAGLRHHQGGGDHLDPASDGHAGQGDDLLDGRRHPIEPLSHVRRPVSHFLKQRFAQVTNPPIDHYRENEVMSLRTLLGPRAAAHRAPEAPGLLELGRSSSTRRACSASCSTRTSPSRPGRRRDLPGGRGARGLARRRSTGSATRPWSTSAPVPASWWSPTSGSTTSGAGSRSCSPSARSTSGSSPRACAPRPRSSPRPTRPARPTTPRRCSGTAPTRSCPRLVLQTITDLADEGRIGGDNPSRVRGPGALPQRHRGRRAQDHVEDGHLVLDSYRGAQIFEALGLGPT